MTSGWSAIGLSAGSATLTLALLAAASGCSNEADPASRSASATLSAPAPGASSAPPDPAPAPPDPAPAPPDPAPPPPDPAPPAPAPPDTEPPDPAPAPPDADADADPDPDPAPVLPVPAAATRTPSATTLACDAVEEELTDAIIRYEVQALAEEGPGGGDRAAAGADMTAAMDRARAEAVAVPGLATAAAPAMAEVVALRDGLAVREDLDEEDAEAWRDARDQLETWCAERG